MIIKRLLLILSKKYFKKSFPDRLRCNGQTKLSACEFSEKDKLFRSFKKSDLDENRHIKLETIKFPDISCNWDRFSKPEDVWFRENGSAKDGCYSITVKDARFENIATPVHDPIRGQASDFTENFSHVEIRLLPDGKDFSFEPPKGKKLNSKEKKLKYRAYIQAHYITEIKAL